MEEADVTADNAFEVYFTDRRLQYLQGDNRRRSKVRGYGRGDDGGRREHERRTQKDRYRNRIPRDVCVICFQKGCCSRCEKAKQVVQAFLNTSGDDHSDGKKNKKWM